MNYNERLRYRIKRQLKNVLWFIDYFIWLIFSPYKFKKLTKVESVLVVEDRSLGDLLVCTPLLTVLKRHFKQVNVLVKEGMQDGPKGEYTC